MIVELSGPLQKPNVELEDTGVALDTEMMEAYLYPIRASFEDTDYYVSSIPIPSGYPSLGGAEQHALDGV